MGIKAKSLRQIGIVLACTLVVAPFVAFPLCLWLFCGELFKEYPVLSEISSHASGMKVAAGTIYGLSWIVAVATLVRGHSKESAVH